MFTCTVTGNPTPNVYWERNGKILQNNEKYQTTQSGDKHTLVIHKTSKEDAGKYICRLDNQIVSMVHSTSLIVQEKSQVATTDFRSVLKKRTTLEKIGPQSSTESEKSDKENNERRTPVFKNILAKMEDNNVRPRNNDGHASVRNKFEESQGHKPTIMKNVDVSSVVVQSKKPVAELKPFNHYATLPNRKPDSNFQKAKDNFMRKSMEDLSQYEKYTAKPFFPKSSSNSKVQNGGNFSINNNDQKSNSSQVDFRKEARIKPMEIKKPLEMEPTKPKQMDFRNVLKPVDADSKSKDCVDFRNVLKPKEQIKNVQSVQHDFRHILTNKTEPKCEPKFVKNLSSQKVKYGSQAVLLCEVTGSPEPDIKWKMNRKEIQPSKYLHLKYKNSIASLTINEAFSEDEGEYTVTASNSLGSVETSCKLSIEESSSMSSSRSDSRSFEGPVAFPPKILNVTPTNVSAMRNKTTEIKAAFNGEPSPTITWFKFKHELETEGRIHIKTLSNSSVLTIQDLQQADSGNYTIVAQNDLGRDTAKISVSVEDVPYAPMGRPFVSDVNRSSVSLSWYGPAYDGGSPITSYSIEACKGNSRKWTTVTKCCRNTFYQVDGLEMNLQYVFRVRAVNKHGESEPGESSELVMTYDDHSSSMDYESDDELPFEPHNVTIDKSRKFEDFYETLEEIGRGKFGNVFKCKEKSSNTIWAAKVLKCREREKANIRNEIEVMNKLRHPKVLLLWDAFEAQRNIVLVLEYIEGGELFERVISDDFELTERDVVHFMRQICDGVGYIHDQGIIHLDLKPENILCISNKTNQIKIIDFGLAQQFKSGQSVKVLFGTPEFIAPEVVNYDEISFSTDLWSIGVICYVLLSGLSPFLGDSDNETLSNVTLGDYDFDDDAFTDISDNAKKFIQDLLIKKKEKRATIVDCKNNLWLAQDERRIRCKRLNTEKLKHFMARRKWQTSVSSPLTTEEENFKYDQIDTSEKAPTAAPLSLPRESTLPVDISVNPRPSPRSNLASRLQGLTLNYAEQESDEYGHQNVNNNNSGESQFSKGDNLYGSLGFQPITSDVHDVKYDDPTKSSVIKLENSDPIKNNDTDPPSSKPIKNIFTDLSDREPITTKVSGLRPITIDNNEINPINNSVCNDKDNSPITDNETVIKDNCSMTIEKANSSLISNEDSDHSVNTFDVKQNQNTDKLKPKFSKEMMDCEAFSGDVIRFDVLVSPNCDITWYFEDDKIIEDERHSIYIGGNGRCSLIIRQVTTDDDGEYTCKAVNKCGESSCSADLIVCGTGTV